MNDYSELKIPKSLYKSNLIFDKKFKPVYDLSVLASKEEVEKLVLSFSNQQEENGDLCSLTVSISVVTRIQQGEGPIAIANRVNQYYQKQLDNHPKYLGLDMTFDWYDVVIQNWKYFDNIVDQSNRDNPFYWSNAKTKAGDLIYLNKHSVVLRPCKYEYNSIGDLADQKGKKIDIGKEKDASIYVKGKGYGKTTLGLRLGIEENGAKAYVDLSLVGMTKEDFLIDNDPNTLGSKKQSGSLLLKITALAEGSLGKFKAGADFKWTWNIIDNQTKYDGSAYYKWKEVEEYDDEKKKPISEQKSGFSGKMGLELKIRKFKYESDKNQTEISFNIKAFASIKYTLRLHPLIRFYVELEAGADVDFVVVLPGNYEPEYINNSEMIDFGKTIEKVGLITPTNDTLSPLVGARSITLPRNNY